MHSPAVVTAPIVIAIFLGLAIQDVTGQQAVPDALSGELLTFVKIVGQFDPVTRFQMRGADAPSVPLLTGVEPSADWGKVGVGSASGRGISDGLCVPSVAIAPDGMPYIVWCDDSGGSGGDCEICMRRWSGSRCAQCRAGIEPGGTTPTVGTVRGDLFLKW